MTAYWVKFSNHSAGCIEGVTENEAREAAEALNLGGVVSMSRIPYPARPRLHQIRDANGHVAPSFCTTPSRCAGHYFCPKKPCCTE
jgi:hypothetical protein